MLARLIEKKGKHKSISPFAFLVSDKFGSCKILNGNADPMGFAFEVKVCGGPNAFTHLYITDSVKSIKHVYIYIAKDAAGMGYYYA